MKQIDQALIAVCHKHNSSRRKSNDIEIIEFLLSKGANVNVKSEDDYKIGYTPLMLASQKDLELTKFLVEHGADVNAKNNAGFTALMWAGIWNSKGHIDIMEYLLDMGADVHSKTNEGKDIFDIIRPVQEVLSLLNKYR